MTEKNQHLYEGMYIINATRTDDARNKVLAKIQENITKRGGKILKVHDQGRKRLAYEINKHREGRYYLIYFEVDPDTISELWQEYRLMEDLIRFLTVRTEKVMEKIEFKPLLEQ